MYENAYTGGPWGLSAETLASAGIPVRAMVAPIIPGLNDREVPALLKAARGAGAWDARYILLRLPLTVEPVFEEWLLRTHPLQAAKVNGHIRQTRGGKMNASTWGTRMVGTGVLAEQIRTMFTVFRKQLGFGDLPPLACDLFRPPPDKNGQQLLF